MKLWQVLTLATTTLGLSHVAEADMIGVYASVDDWNLQGHYTQTTTGQSNDGAALDFSHQGQAQIAVSIEHPVPLIPNVRLRHVSLSTQTKQTQAASNLPVYDVSLNSTDFILYYELLDNWLSVDVGLAAKHLDGDVVYNSLTGQDTLKISRTVPMVYGSVAASLPLTGLSAKAELLATQYSDTHIHDVSAEIKYDFIDTLLLDVGAKAGYRVLNLDLDDQGGKDSRFRFNGPYVGLEAHF